MYRSAAIAVVLGSLVVACAGASEEAPESASFEVGTCTQIADEDVEHACLHGGAGPFRDVTASLTTPPDVSRAHTAYRVKLAPDASGTRFGGSVRFVPNETGEFAIYTTSNVPRIRLSGANGPVAFDCSTAVPTSLCGSLRRLRVVDLTEGAPVTLTFQASTTASTVLLIEHVEEHDDHDH